MKAYSDKDLDELLQWYDSGLLAHHDKGEKAESDIPELIEYIRFLKNVLGIFEYNSK